MKQVANMSAEELAGFVCQALHDTAITVTLTGGACVAIWSHGKYVSYDLDFVEEGPVPRRKVREALSSLGFKEKGRYFVHPQTMFFVEFPTGPLMVGNQRVEKVSERHTPTGNLRLLSPTDCVKDRLAAFFHWNDRQALEQALLVAVFRRSTYATFVTGPDRKRTRRSSANSSEGCRGPRAPRLSTRRITGRRCAHRNPA